MITNSNLIDVKTAGEYGFSNCQDYYLWGNQSECL